MFTSASTLLALLPLLSLPTLASARDLNSGLSARGELHHNLVGKSHYPSVPDFDKIKREDGDKNQLDARSSPSSGTKSDKKKKRKVRKRTVSCNPQAGFSVSASASPSVSVSPTSSSSLWATTSSSTVLGSENIATGGTHSSSSTTTHKHSTSTSTSITPTSSSSSSSSGSSDWTLVQKWSGSSFFDNWDFWSYDDPTHGTVTYVDSSTAWNQGLVSINSDGHAIMKVDTTENVSGGRQSVRIQGNIVYTGGLVIMDAVHMPTGCGTWPAWWSNGPNWPAGGEIDILEGINAFTQNQVSLHTNPGCTMPQGGMTMLGELTTGSYDSYDCSSADTSNQGCGVRDQTNDNSLGSAFNSAGGGVYAMRWDKTGINVWFFTRSSVPSDISNGEPDPSGWGTPVANYPATSCDPYEYFYEHFPIFDTTLCGDWAGADSVWNYAGYAGQSQSCASMTGYSTCSDFVLNSGSSFSEAYWEVSYVAFYNSTTQV